MGRLLQEVFNCSFYPYFHLWLSACYWPCLFSIPFLPADPHCSWCHLCLLISLLAFLTPCLSSDLVANLASSWLLLSLPLSATVYFAIKFWWPDQPNPAIVEHWWPSIWLGTWHLYHFLQKSYVNIQVSLQYVHIFLNENHNHNYNLVCLRKAFHSPH